jgi:hypothetical protein
MKLFRVCLLGLEFGRLALVVLLLVAPEGPRFAPGFSAAAHHSLNLLTGRRAVPCRRRPSLAIPARDDLTRNNHLAANLRGRRRSGDHFNGTMRG